MNNHWSLFSGSTYVCYSTQVNSTHHTRALYYAVPVIFCEPNKDTHTPQPQPAEDKTNGLGMEVP